MGPSALWLFAHRALARHFHDDPERFVAALDGAEAPRFLDDLWSWALSAGKASEPAHPPVTYGIDRPEPGVAILSMHLSGVTQTGEPWQLRFVVSDDPAYARMFLLEHSEHASEQAGTPTAIVCESERGGKHRNWGTTTAPTDTAGFDEAMVAAIQSASASKPS
jgi:hypothetical protein